MSFRICIFNKILSEEVLLVSEFTLSGRCIEGRKEAFLMHKENKLMIWVPTDSSIIWLKVFPIMNVVLAEKITTFQFLNQLLIIDYHYCLWNFDLDWTNFRYFLFSEEPFNISYALNGSILKSFFESNDIFRLFTMSLAWWYLIVLSMLLVGVGFLRYPRKKFSETHMEGHDIVESFILVESNPWVSKPSFCWVPRKKFPFCL